MRIKKPVTGGEPPQNNTIYIIIISILVIVIILGIILYITPFTMLPKIVQNVSIEQPQKDDFFDIYSPPLRNNPYFPSTSSSNRNFSLGNDFTQVGILKNNDANTNANFLPIFGRPLSTSRDQWQYYALSNTGSIPGIKLNLTNEKGKDLMNDIGAPELYNDDTVVVDGYDKPMKVSIYKQKQLYYI